ncbi:MAG: C4-dicarboxylate TRAP transporter substrate-binding protein [Candidatus Velthaea sp.]
MNGTSTRKRFLAATAAGAFATPLLRRAAGAADYKPLTIKVSHEAPVGFINDVILKRWAEVVKQRSNGAIGIEIYPSGQLFNDENALQTLITSRGQSVQMVSATPFYFVNYEPSVGVYLLPFTINSPEQFRRSLHSPAGRTIEGRLKAKGFHIVGDLMDLGSFLVVSSKRPISAPQDMKGMKIRTLGGKIVEATLAAFGASPITLAAPNVALALSQGTIDASISSYPFWSTALSGVAKYGVDPQMIRSGYINTFSESWWNEQPPATQALLEKTLSEAIRVSWPRTDGIIGVSQNNLKSKGDELIVLNDGQREAWKREAAPVLQQYEASVGKDIVNAFQKSVR